MENTETETGIDKAVRLAHGQTALGKLFDPPVSPQAVQKWVAKGVAPSDRCREIEKKLDGRVTRYELNPVVFGYPPEAPGPESAPAQQEDGHQEPPVTAGDRTPLSPTTQ